MRQYQDNRSTDRWGYCSPTIKDSVSGILLPTVPIPNPLGGPISITIEKYNGKLY